MKTFQDFRFATAIVAFLWVVLSALIPPHQTATAPNRQNNQVSITATGTGQTTGTIAKVKITNQTNVPATLTLGRCIIPSNGKVQGYVVPLGTTVTIAPNSSLVAPLHGYCTHINLPPAENNQPLPPYNTWLQANDLVLDANWQPQTANGWQPSPYPNTILIPGTNQPLNYIIDMDKHLTEVAPLIFEAVTRLEQAYDELNSHGSIQTPLSYNPTEQRNGVLQHATWGFTAALTGKPYKKEDFAQNIIKQFEENTQQKYRTAPQNTRNEVEQGINSLWTTFELVGVKAKILPPNQQEEPTLIDNQENNKPRCNCGDITFKVTMDGQTFKISSADGVEQPITGTPTFNVKNKLTITDVKVNCPCSEGGGMCDFYAQDFAPDKKNKATLESSTHDITGAYELNKKATHKTSKVVKLTISAWCKGNTCEENKDCKKDFELTFERGKR